MRNIATLLALASAGMLQLSGMAETANVAPNGTAFASGPLWGPGNWDIKKLIDGDRSGVFHGDATLDAGFAYSVDLGKPYEITELRIYPRQDGCCPERLSKIHVSVHNDDGTGKIGTEVWGTDKFTDGTNAGSSAGSLVIVTLPAAQTARWVRVLALADPVPAYALQMTELEVLATVLPEQVNRAAGARVAVKGSLFGTQVPGALVDGDRGSFIHGTETIDPGFSYEIDLGTAVTFDHINVIARQDGCCAERLTNYRLSIHKDNNGAIGDAVWTADLHTDASNPGSEPGAKDVIQAALNPAGQFKGQWIRVASLENPISSYALQISELEAFGVPEAGTKLVLTQDPRSALVGLGGNAKYSATVNLINGDNARLSYQWQLNGVDLPGATNATFTTAAITLSDANNKYRVIASYPGVAPVTSKEAGLKIDYALGALAFSNRDLYAGWPITWVVDGDLANVLHGNTDLAVGFAYDINLRSPVNFDSIEIYPRQDGCCPERLTNFRVSIHKDNGGAIGDAVWHTDLFTDGSNPGSGPGIVVKVTKDLDAAGTFQGQWIRILSLEDPVQNYALQMSEVVVFGTLLETQAKVAINAEPANGLGAPGRVATFSVTASVVNGDPKLLTYQWKRNGTAIPGANADKYTTPVLVSADQDAKFSVVVSYPGATSVESKAATLVFDYNYARGGTASSNRPLYAGWPISWLVDGDRKGVFHGDAQIAPGFAYEVNMGELVTIDHIDIYPRQDSCCPERLTNFRVSVHKDNGGVIGDTVWSADLYTDGSNPGVGQGVMVTLTKDLNPSGQFQGQWVRIESLENPVQDYALQMTELEVIGRVAERPRLAFAKSASSVSLSWTEGALEQADAVIGPWTSVAAAVSPFNVSLTLAKKFYRLRK